MFHKENINYQKRFCSQGLKQSSRIYFVNALLVTIFFSAGCMTTQSTLQYVTTRKVFELEKPAVYESENGLLSSKYVIPAGEYISNYQDAGGIYFEAPYSSDEDSYFARMDRGGIYVKHGAPRRAYIYGQDSRTKAVYTGYAPLVTGGSGKFRLIDEIPPQIVRSFNFKNYKQDY
jgi:hypothetical protein